ncbi:uncharacterized protein METZ01_LOCUS172950, partial [marine metagenome]
PPSRMDRARQQHSLRRRVDPLPGAGSM